MNTVITAQWARDEAKKFLAVEIHAQLSMCEAAIKKASNSPECKCMVKGGINRFVRSELTGRGFDVIQCTIKGETETKISW